MKLLDWNTTSEDVLKDFPMLEDATSSELQVMKETCDDDDDAPFVRAIDILLKRMDEGTYHVPDTDDDDYPTPEPEHPPRRSLD